MCEAWLCADRNLSWEPDIGAQLSLCFGYVLGQSQVDQTVSVNDEQGHSYFSHHAGLTFKRVREAAGIDEDSYIAALTKSGGFIRKKSDGMSRCHFYTLDTPWLMVKQVRGEEAAGD